VAFQRHWLFTFGGSLAGRDEWTCGIRMSIDDGFLPKPEAVAEDAALESFATPLRNWFGSTALRLSSQASLTFAKLNEIRPDGRYADQTTTHRLDFTEPTYGSLGRSVPLDMAAAVTWITSAARGQASKGRIYLPCPGWDLTSAGTFSTENVQGALNSTGTFLAALQPSAATGGLRPAVISPGTVSSSEGAGRFIRGMRIGDVPDRQRRRREGTPEVYTTRML
jgi:hypothetical protein